MKAKVLILCAAGVVSAWGQRVTDRRSAEIRGGGGEGKCTIEVVVDGAAEVEISGQNASIRTLSGSPASFRRFQCNQAMPGNPNDFRFQGIDGRGRQDLVRSPRGGRAAVIRIEDPKGGREGYTFDIFWRGGGDGFGGGFGGGGRGGRYGGDRSPDYQGERGQSTVSCASNDGRRNYCGNYNYDQVRLDRQISGSPCIQGQTWGVDRAGLWVDRGCRAIFTISGNGGGDWNGGSNNGWWDRDQSFTWPPQGNWRGGNWGAGGACFYKDSNFGGSYFCMRRGESRDSLGGYGDQISSVRLFGGARAIIFDDRDFSGARETVFGDVRNLHQLGVAQKPGHTWNNRVSSIRVQ